jgi:hypothetical protein
MPDDLIYALAVERNGVVWCGTATQGVVRFDENNVSGTGELVTNSPLSIFPNPTSGLLHVNATKTEMKSIRISDTQGRSVVSKSFSSIASVTLDVKELPAGVYFLSVQTGDGIYSKKIIRTE